MADSPFRNSHVAVNTGQDNHVADATAGFIGPLLLSPILWGSLATAGFYSLIRLGVIDSPFVRDYFAGHPVEYVTTIMFFIGVAALLIRGTAVLWQSGRLAGSGLLLAAPPSAGQSIADCPKLLAQLDAAAGSACGHLLMSRLREILKRVMRRGSADGLEDELKYLADREADRVYESYALFRVITWAIPVLGFLGTVIGITLAIGNLDPAALEESVGQVVLALRIAFATTTQALSLSIVLMFMKYLVSQAENNLLARVDRRVEDELLGRFEVVSSKPDGQLAAVRCMAEAVIDSSQQLLKQQVGLWQKTIAEAENRWSATAAESGRQLQTALDAALQNSLRVHAESLASSEREQAEKNRQHWQQVQQSLAETAHATHGLQVSVADQVKVLRRTVEATGQVARLEETLNRNLSALAGSKNFEATVMSLAAAIHLLNARLGSDVAGEGVELDPQQKATQAA